MRNKRYQYCTLLLFVCVVGWAGIVVSFLWSPAIGGTTSSLDEVLDQWATALGGRDRLSDIRTTHIISTVKMFGLEGCAEEWFTAEGKHRLDLDLAGVFTMTVVTIPGHSWYKEQNSAAVQQEGKDLEDEIRDVYLGTWSYVLPDRMTGEIELLSAESEKNELAVRIVPSGGTEVTVILDQESHLPKRCESTDETGEALITSFSDWRTFEGILFPAHTEMITGTPENDTVIELSDIQFNETVPAGIFSKPVPPSEEVHFTTGYSVRDIPLDIDGVHIFLQGSIGDSPPLWFILDTGASMTCIDRATASSLGLEVTGQILGNGVGEEKVEVSFVQNVSLRVPGVELPKQTAAAVDLASLESGFGREIHGILGYDFISRFVVEIDYLNEKLHLYDRTQWEYRGSGSEVAIRFQNNKPVCDASITLPNGESIDCIIRFDTGSGTTIRFNRPFTEEHNLLATLPKVFESRGGFGLGGVTTDYLGRIAAIRIGDLEFMAPNCSFSQDEKGISADPSHAGKVGGRLLERCTVILDYGGERITLEPNATFGAPFPGEMCGMSIRSGSRGDWHTFTVVNVIAGSPADEAGMKAGDVIVSIDGRPATDLRLWDLKAMFREKARQIRMGLKRDGETFYRTLRMEPIL
jgi:hypothetical protein